MTSRRWYGRPREEGLALRTTPRLASWNKANDPEQVRLGEYLVATADLLSSSMITGPWSLLLDVGLPARRNFLDMADLDNYAYPLAWHLRDEALVSVWCTKWHADATRVVVAPAREVVPPGEMFTARTTASSETRAYKEQVRGAVAGARQLPAGPVRLQISFVVGPGRNWLNLWKPTIDALDPLLGRTRTDRDWHPMDGRIVDLGLHVVVEPSLGHDVVVAIAVG
jgi:hypothetical protein